MNWKQIFAAKKEEPVWLQYASPKYREKYREKLAERELFEMRKQLFNAEKPKKSVEGGEKKEFGLRKLRQKHDPNLPHPSLPRLMSICRQKVNYWKEEQEKQEKKREEQLKTLLV